MKLEAIELEIHRAFQERLLDANPRLLLTASKLAANRVSAKFMVAVLPFHYFDAEGAHRRLGARWHLFASNVKSWPLTERTQLINIVIDEVEQYIKQGTIEREEHTTHDINGSRYRLQRYGNPTN